MQVDEFFDERERRTAQKVADFADSFEKHLQEDGSKALAQGCVYVVGSAGRGEMTPSSDLDLFLVTHAEPRRVHEILAQAAVLRMMSENGLPEPSNDALFLRLYAARDLERRLGAVQDDPENTFTARMLLVLESRVLYGQEAYGRLISSVLDAYWRNKERHSADYLPIVLVNDVVRYWRVLLLNYEAKFERKRVALGENDHAASDAQQAWEQDKWFASYKLRFSRCMTCYSMIARLLAETASVFARPSHVSQEALLQMIESSPIRRLRQIRELARDNGRDEVTAVVNNLLELYRGYLEFRDQADATARAQFVEVAPRRELLRSADQFGARMFDLLQLLGPSSLLYRYVVA
jgi:predicted nucleotidyltransferase